MTIATLVEKLRSKRQVAERSTFQHYLAMVKELAAGTEIDADECSHILESADRDETTLEKDVGIQQQRNTWHAKLEANQQAVKDSIVAERDVVTAQAALQKAYDRLQPEVDAAHAKLADANHRQMGTQGAENWLAENVLDSEIQQREQEVVAALRPVISELSPLLQDREHKQHSLENAEYNLSKLQARKDGDWVPAGIVQFFNQPADIRVLVERVADLQSQMSQLDRLIHPRQQEQQRLQNELAKIHEQKLLP